SLFQIINFTLIFIVLFFFVKYIWSVFYDKTYQPVQWEHKVKTKQIPKELIRLERNYPDKVRFFNFWFQIERIKKENIKGCFAELGVYKGETAKIIHKMYPSRKFYLFDTFDGLKTNDLNVETGEAATYNTQNFADTNIDRVKNHIEENENIIFRKGYFPETTKGLENETYAFVNMDADLHNPTKEGLLYFYPRLAPGGVIIIHDYNYKWEGAVKAVDDFMKTIPESLIMLPDMFCSVMIIKNK
ncbi:MAG: TylF/MycF family methyltransferase, partial [Bacteroidales bacterium]|nr:TylF/MycF family methyltransferase [Bacteroidales bacterium]